MKSIDVALPPGIPANNPVVLCLIVFQMIGHFFEEDTIMDSTSPQSWSWINFVGYTKQTIQIVVHIGFNLSILTGK